MYARSMMDNIRDIESALGHSHRCSLCRNTFLQHQDGCPHCGVGAPVQSLQKGKILGNTLSWMIFDSATGEFICVSYGQSSPWPHNK
jgi:hypothetical protein